MPGSRRAPKAGASPKSVADPRSDVASARRHKDQRRIPLSLRLTPEMRQHLERIAERNGRSLTQQTEFLLEYAMRLERVMTIPPPP